MRSAGLAQIIREVQDGVPSDAAIGAFVDAFDLAPTDEARFALLEHGAALTNDRRLNAVIGAIAEYLAKQHRLGRVPVWTSESVRYLDEPRHTSSIFIDWRREILTDGMREYLTFASPAEFASRNIFTEERPLRRARGPRPPPKGLPPQDGAMPRPLTASSQIGDSSL